MTIRNHLDIEKNLASLFASYSKTYSSLLADKKIHDDFKKFHLRASLLYTSNIRFHSNELNSAELKAQEYSLRLSEAWFCYEALIPIFERMNLVLAKTHSVAPSKNVTSIQDALRITREPVEAPEPYGKPNFLDFEFSKIWSVSERLEEVIAIFSEIIMQITTDDTKRKVFNDYLYYLEENSTGAQKKLVRSAHNDINNNNNVHAKDILCIAYAIRNQYVHSGEVICSSDGDPEVKCEVIRACYLITLLTIFTIADAILWEL